MLNFDQAPCPLAITDSRGGILGANDYFLRTVGSDRAFWLGQSIDAACTVASRIFLQTHAWPMLLREGEVREIRLQLVNVQKQSIPVLVNCQRSAVDGTDTYHWVFFITNERARFEEELLEARKRADTLADRFARSEQFMRTVTDAVPSLIAYWDSDLCCRFANQVFLDWIGKTSAEAMGTRFQSLLGDAVFQLNRSFIEGVLAGTPQEFEREVPRFDGVVRATLESYIPDIGPSGDVLGFYVVVADVTRVKEGDAAVRLNASVFSATSEGIMVTDAAGALVAVNPAFCAITGYEEHAVLGHNPRFLQSGKHSAEFYAELWQSLLDNESWAGELWCKRKNGELYLEALSISSIKDAHGKAVRYVGVFSDVTARHAHDEQIRHLALHDALTNLPNRRLMSERLTQLLELSTREPRKLAVIFLDLDGFKSINDQHGHDVGDFVLKTVAVRLHELFRTVDTVARFGGDEFVVLIHNAEGTESLVQIAQRIVATVNLPIRVGTICAQVGTSVGISVHPQNGSSVDELLTHADAAMYEAKRSGKNTFRFTPAPV